jgi:hypothetical protein
LRCAPFVIGFFGGGIVPGDAELVQRLPCCDDEASCGGKYGLAAEARDERFAVHTVAQANEAFLAHQFAQGAQNLVFAAEIAELAGEEDIFFGGGDTRGDAFTKEGCAAWETSNVKTRQFENMPKPDNNQGWNVFSNSHFERASKPSLSFLRKNRQSILLFTTLPTLLSGIVGDMKGAYKGT